MNEHNYDTNKEIPPPIELVTNVSKVWDYKNPDHVDLVIDDIVQQEDALSAIFSGSFDFSQPSKQDAGKTESTRKEIMSGNWQSIERAIEKIEELGFDAFLVREDGAENLGVFNAQNVKLIKDQNAVDANFAFNRTGEVAGTFDPNNPDLRFMPAAYHGTPHTFAAEPGAPFGRFRTSAIGTGEGAQAYGHGLYFAGKKEVAEHYRKVLTQDERGFYDGQPYNSRDPRHQAALDLENFGDREALIGYYERRAKRMPNADRSDLVKILRDKTEAKKTPPPKGSLYKVELAPKENEYLLYDKTLGEQPKGVQNKVRKVLTELEGEDLWEYRKGLDYRDITQNALENIPEPEISRRLKEAGIPGIKYLDGSSRSKGKGDYNYVIFDEADVQITDKLFMPASEAGAGKGKQPANRITRLPGNRFMAPAASAGAKSAERFR